MHEHASHTLLALGVVGVVAAVLELDFVRCPEYRGCPYLGGWKYTIRMEITVGATACDRCTEVVRISKCPLFRGFTVYRKAYVETIVYLL